MEWEARRSEEAKCVPVSTAATQITAAVADARFVPQVVRLTAVSIGAVVTDQLTRCIVTTPIVGFTLSS